MCHYCGREATHEDSIPDPKKQGVNRNECGYTIVPLCGVCAEERRRVATSRVRPIGGDR